MAWENIVEKLHQDNAVCHLDSGNPVDKNPVTFTHNSSGGFLGTGKLQKMQVLSNKFKFIIIYMQTLFFSSA